MHVLILPSWFPGSGNNAGIFIYDQILSLSKIKDLKLSVLDWGPNEYVFKLRNPIQSIQNIIKYKLNQQHIDKKNDNLSIYSLPHITWTSYLFKGNYDALIPRAIDYIKEIEAHNGKIDLIHAHVTFPAGYLAMYISDRLNIPYIITEHSGPFPFKEYRTASGIRGIVTQPLNKAKEIIAVSSWLSNSIIKYTENIPIVIPNSVDTEFFKPADILNNVKPEPLIFTLTKMTQNKGIGDYLEALKLLKDKGYKFKVRIGGSGNSFSYFKKLSVKYCLSDCITWLGNLNRKEALAEYQACDFYVMPSRLESLSMVILEAAACGKPIVSTDCGGPKDIIDKALGFMVKTGNSNSLAQGIETMLSTYQTYDSKLIRENCINRFSPEIIDQRIYSIYKKALSKK